MGKPRVLFLCTANACRSQMAEGWTRHLWGERYEVHSAGVAPATLSRRAAKVMAEAGVDLAGQRAKSVRELLAAGLKFDYVITVCDHAREACPVFPGKTRLIHAGFPDPDRLAAGAAGEEEVLAQFRRLRDEIRDFVARLPEVLKQPARETRA